MSSIATWSVARAPVSALAIASLTFVDRGRDALARPAVAAVAKLGGLELAGRGARGHRGAAAWRPILEPHVGLDRRIAPRVEDLARVDAFDDSHDRRGRLDEKALRRRSKSQLRIDAKRTRAAHGFEQLLAHLALQLVAGRGIGLAAAIWLGAPQDLARVEKTRKVLRDVARGCGPRRRA